MKKGSARAVPAQVRRPAKLHFTSTPSPSSRCCPKKSTGTDGEAFNDTAQRHPNLNLTQEEKRVFYQLFQVADTTNLGVITGEIAVPFFEKTKLPSGTLGEVRYV